MIYLPEHPKSMTNENWKGYIYEHIVIAEKSIGRSIRDDEDVHHLDGDKSNNNRQNLIVLPRSEHARLESWINKGAPSAKIDLIRKQIGYTQFQPKVKLFCKSCNKQLNGSQSLYCSNKCLGKLISKRPSKQILLDDLSKMTKVAIGKKYGVSDSAVRKWKKQYQI